MSNNNKKNDNKTAIKISPAHTWGTAVTVTAKDGTPREWAAVRFEEGKSGYITEGDLYDSVPACRTLNAAVIRAVERAALLGEKVTDKARERYPHALRVERDIASERALKAVERAQEAATAAAAAAMNAEKDAAAILANIPA